MQTKICTKCKKEFPATTEFFHKSKQGRFGLHSWCKNCYRVYGKKYQQDRRKTKGKVVRAYDRNRAEKFKQKWVDYKGGKCSVCGYDKCIGALEFHHTNPEEKDFGISKSAKGLCNEKIKKELDKCLLLCANCHREIHYANNRL